jgi:hypothetical protein
VKKELKKMTAARETTNAANMIATYCFDVLLLIDE